ncbi:MAG: HD domain-containing protein [Sarcina sp.]
MNNKDLFLQIQKHLLEDSNPSIYLRKILNDGTLKNSLFYIISDLENIKQNPIYHPEGCVLTHTFLVIDEAAKVKEKANNKEAFMWAALLHDIGKTKTTLEIDGEIIDKNHERASAEMTRRLLREVSNDLVFNENVINLVKHHMTHLYVINKLPYGNVHNMVNTTDIHDIALLSYCDRIGKEFNSLNKKNEILKSVNKFLTIISQRTYNNYKALKIN